MAKSKQLSKKIEEADELQGFSYYDNKLSNFKDIKNLNGCNVFVGWDCVEKFVDYLLDFTQKHEKVMFKFISYNGCNFDNIIFLNKLLKMNSKVDKYIERLNISDIFYNGSQLLNFKINRKHHFFDVAKFLCGSLADNCKAFDLPKDMCKKGFNHHFTQMLYDENKLDGLLNDETCKFYEKLYEYNAFDVISLSLIYIR